MSEYKLHCFGESGNAYKAALMLELSRCDWTPVWVDYFNGETRSAEYRAQINEMGEVPVLTHKGLKLTQTGVILDYLAEQTRKFGPKSDDERREILRWILFDNHKFTSYLATLRFLINFAKSGETPVTDFLRPRVISALKIVDLHLADRPFIVGRRATIADFSLCGYLFFGDELPIALEENIHVMKWLDRIRALPGWKHPYDLMPRQSKQ
jgi:glutathione S-transferase